jgi:phosphatidylinositol-3-phosphatase
VLLIMLENKGYAATLGSCSADPYLCGLAAQYTSVIGWTGISHPSEPNYLAVTTGGMQGCTSDTCFKTLTVPSLGGQLSVAGVPWTAYMESMPSACFTGQWAPQGMSGTSALYGEKHDPFVVEGDVLSNGCASHVLPYPGVSSMVTSLTGVNAPAFVWITPNQQDDMHSNTVQAGDAWLKANIAPVLASSWFTGGDATVIVTMDEGPSGNAIPMVVISSNAKGQGNVNLAGNHYGTLRSIEEAYGLSLLAGAQNASYGDVVRYFG